MSRRLRGGVGVAVAFLAAGCFHVGFDGTSPGTEADLPACTNFFDDDGDALVDCSDPDCAGVCDECLPGECNPGFARCLEGNQVVQVCDATGTLFCPVGACAPDQVCAGFQCVMPACQEGEALCQADGQIVRCLAGT